jgi:hypothetical protein
LIPSFNTQNPALIKEEIINISPTLITQLMTVNNGILIRPTNNSNDPGAVFCSKDSDAFCLPQFAPKLLVNYIQNNAPNTPLLQSPADQSVISGKCDNSVEPVAGICADLQSSSFPLSNVGDNDPVPGDIDKTFIDFFQNGNIVKTSNPIIGSGSVAWTGNFDDGVYQWKARSIDKAGMFGQYSTERTITFDSTPPLSPTSNSLSPTVDITTGNIQISSSMTSDNISQTGQISYSMQYSSDPTFTVILNPTEEWKINDPVFNIKTGNLTPGTSYYFRIKAKDSAENISEWSNVVSTTIIDATTLGIPTIDKTGWDVNDGILADGIKPERSRLTPFHVLRSNSIIINGKSEKDRKIEIFVNDKSVGIVEQDCTTPQGTCDFKFEYKFTDNGSNNSAGVPLNSAAIQVRAISPTGHYCPEFQFL